MESFEDIRIVDLEAERTSWSRVDSTLRTVYLRLNAAAPGVQWVKFFHEERDSRVMARRRGFWIENQYLVLDCLPEEIEPYHLPDLQRSLDYANAKYRHFLVEEAERWRELTRLDDDESRSLQAVRTRLRTSLGVPLDPVPEPPPAATPATPAPVAPVAPLVPDDVRHVHDRVVAAAAKRVVPDRPPTSLVPREEAVPLAMPASAPPPKPAPPPDRAATQLAESASAGTPASPSEAAPPPKPVDAEDVETRLAQYRATVRAAFRKTPG